MFLVTRPDYESGRNGPQGKANPAPRRPIPGIGREALARIGEDSLLSREEAMQLPRFRQAGLRGESDCTQR
jgi:hypothetical protein